MSDHKVYRPIMPISTGRTTPATNKSLPGNAFKEILDNQISGLKFSQHAQQRLKARNIQLSSQELQQLNAALDKAAQKGAKESLFVMQKLALVVNVPNKTVITAVDGASMKENVFTNIDSAVIV